PYDESETSQGIEELGRLASNPMENYDWEVAKKAMEDFIKKVMKGEEISIRQLSRDKDGGMFIIVCWLMSL
ncbi:MAG: hypothetical protein ACTSYA_04215, partial [Candidatus Kariarchaeaceae archaeon]